MSGCLGFQGPDLGRAFSSHRTEAAKKATRKTINIKNQDLQQKFRNLKTINFFVGSLFDVTFFRLHRTVEAKITGHHNFAAIWKIPTATIETPTTTHQATNNINSNVREYIWKHILWTWERSHVEKCGRSSHSPSFTDVADPAAIGQSPFIDNL